MQIQHTTANAGVAVVEGTYNATYGYASGSLQCVNYCGGSFGVATGAAAVPEPANWTMMIGGFALVGSTLRRRRLALAQV